MEHRKPAKSPCPICAQPLAPQGVALHFQRKHPGEKIPGPPAPASAAQRTESAPASTPASSPASSSSSTSPAKPSAGGILSGDGGILS